jgi:hypothetical protein
LGQKEQSPENSIVDIKKYLSTEESPLTTKEFQEFWNSLSEAEKDEFRKTELK